ncbi:MAG: ferrochelatase [Nocardioidaceae bacterium]|nr:ferrochelatase [Nocardioidaceae bacterium]
MPPAVSVAPYDALLLVSFGGPERPADVVPFLENVTRGRRVPRERLVEVGQHYFSFGGRSPINDQCRALIRAARADLSEHGVDIPIYWGNRNWDPFLADSVEQMRADGVTRAAAFVTSAYSSYAGCRQYREDLYDAVGAPASPPRVDRLRHYFNHRGFVSSFVETTCTALEQLPAGERRQARLVFVTHSIPTAMAETSGPDGGAYVAQHLSAAGLVANGVESRTGAAHEWDLVYCSRSGAPDTPWLQPDVNDHLERLGGAGTRAVVCVPIGFVSDHMEVVYDLDTEAAATADRLGIGFVRAAAPGTHPEFVGMIRDLLIERAAVESGQPTPRAALGQLAPSWDLCAPHCCPNPRGRQPALAEASA